MRCPRCKHEDTKVLESRLAHGGSSIRRRRECRKCEHRYTTYEQEEACVFVVRKRSGEAQPYDRAKALRSMNLACQKRHKVPPEERQRLLEDIEFQLQTLREREISSVKLGSLIMEELKKMDAIAYIRFASVYENIENLEDFYKLLDRFSS